jgi:hypothetical protein
MVLHASGTNKRLTETVTPLSATLTKNRGWGPGLSTFRDSEVQTLRPLRFFNSATFKPANLPTFKRVLKLSPPFFSLSTNNYKLTTVHFFPPPVDIQRIAGHNFCLAPLPSMAPMTEEGE